MLSRHPKIIPKKKPDISQAFLRNKSLAMSYSHMGPPTLPSALLHFTSEFGMGSGGSTVLLSLSKNLLTWKASINTQFLSIQSIVTYEAYMDVGHQVPVWNMVRGLNHLGVVWLSLTGN